MDGLPKEKMHRSNLGAEALAKAMEDFMSAKNDNRKNGGVKIISIAVSKKKEPARW
jgi:hypothetical protein